MALKASVHQFTETRVIRISARDFFYVSNLLSTFRLLIVPFIFYFIYRAQWEIASIFGSAAIVSDMLDGFFARRLNQHTQLGYILDPVADKTAILAVVFALVLSQTAFPLWAFVAIAARDIAIVLGNVILAYKAKMILRSNLWGKCTSLTFAIALMLYLLRPIVPQFPKNIESYSLYLALVFAGVSTWSYARKMFGELQHRHAEQPRIRNI